jgi:hypothetical protein
MLSSRRQRRSIACWAIDTMNGCGCLLLIDIVGSGYRIAIKKAFTFPTVRSFMLRSEELSGAFLKRPGFVEFPLGELRLLQKDALCFATMQSELKMS